MLKYELLIVLPGTLDDKEAADHINEVVEVVKGHGSDVEMQNMGKMRLSYPIKQIRYGYYYTVVFHAEPESVKALQEKLRLRNDLLRAIVTHFKAGYTAAKKIVYSTNEVGVTTMVEKEGKAQLAGEEEIKPAAPSAKVDLKDIDQKLNEILDSDILPGV
jgi:ribosomal protein S6